MFGLNQDGTVCGSLLGGEIKEWSSGATTHTETLSRHKDYINAIVAVGDLIWYASEDKIFIWDSSKDLHHIKVVKSSHTQNVAHLHFNSHSVYSFGADKIMLRY